LKATVAIVGGIGFFLLGMAVMTDDPKAFAGSALRVDAIAHVDAIRLLDQRVHHARRATAHLAAAVA
jgi:hypothetical protein